MSSRSVVRLGNVAGRFARLEVRCARCPRHGLLRLSRLIREHGADMSFPALGNILAAGCPNENGDYGKNCFVIFPQLRGLAAKDQLGLL